MNKIRIKRLAFNSYLEICGTVGLISGVISSILNLFKMIFNVIGNSNGSIGLAILIIILTPILSGIGGLFTGCITYYPYKLYMNFKKGTELRIILEEESQL